MDAIEQLKEDVRTGQIDPAFRGWRKRISRHFHGLHYLDA
jgi:hypothetical protein